VRELPVFDRRLREEVSQWLRRVATFPAVADLDCSSRSTISMAIRQVICPQEVARR
jgi:hypothetical protein